MGTLMREYWVPALLSSELPQPDSDPVRVMLLGEKLIAFRDHQRAGRLDPEPLPSPWRLPVLRPQRRSGLRCVYHGWKFDADGQLRRYAQRAGRVRLQDESQSGGVSDAGAQRPGLGLHGPARRPRRRCRTSRPTTCPRASTRRPPSSGSATTCRGSKATSTPVHFSFLHFGARQRTRPSRARSSTTR